MKTENERRLLDLQDLYKDKLVTEYQKVLALNIGTFTKHFTWPYRMKNNHFAKFMTFIYLLLTSTAGNAI